MARKGRAGGPGLRRVGAGPAVLHGQVPVAEVADEQRAGLAGAQAHEAEDAEQGPRAYKLAAGTLLLYHGGSVHCVTPVTRGERLASFFWIQSMVRSREHRAMLFDLDRIIQRLRTAAPDEPGVVGLTGHYHNLLRLWADI